MSERNDERWKTDRSGPYIRVSNGKKFYLLNPNPDQFDINFIARHAAGVIRYTGASRYSIAQHMVVASRMAALHYPHLPDLPAKMLIHDVAETVLGDVSSPLKSLLPDYRRIEIDMDRAVEEFFDVDFVGDSMVKEVDHRMWLTEKQFVFPTYTDDYAGRLKPFDAVTNGDWRYWTADEAEQEWLQTAAKLLPWMFHAQP